MKKEFIYSLAVVLLLTASCRENEISLEGIDKVSIKENTIFYTSISPYDNNEVSTKTFLNNETKLCWNANDLVSIFDGNTGNKQFKFMGEDGAIEGQLSFVSGSSTGSSLSDSKTYAIYPYNPLNFISTSGVVSTYYPREQKYVAGSFGSGANIMMAVSEAGTGNLLFKNVCGFLKLSLTGVHTITAIRLKGNNHEKISGQMDISVNPGGSPTPFSVTMPSEASEEIVLSLGESGIELSSSPTVFYIALPPTTFDNGITVEVYDINGRYMTKSTSSALSILSNHIKPMETFIYVMDSNTSTFVSDATKCGIYGWTSSEDPFNPRDQVFTSYNPISRFYDFMMCQFGGGSPAYWALSGIPIDALIGDVVTVDYSSEGTLYFSETTISLKVLRKTDTRLWLWYEKSSESRGIIIKNL